VKRAVDRGFESLQVRFLCSGAKPEIKPGLKSVPVLFQGTVRYHVIQSDVTLELIRARPLCGKPSRSVTQWRTGGSGKTSYSDIFRSVLSKMKAIIYDMDGTLVNSLPVYDKAYRHALSVFNIIISKEEVFKDCFMKTDKACLT